MASGFIRTSRNTYFRAAFLSWVGTLLFLIVVASLSACATVGRDFPAAKVYDIQIGKTSQEDIRAMFGPPWRVGIEDGKPTWTYGKYHYSAFGETRTKDLVIRFDVNNIVRSYTFNTSDPGDVKRGKSPGR